MKEEFNNGIEILKKNHVEFLEMESSISQIKNRVESFFSRLNQIESRI
jgi:hypothetical protein